MIEHGVRRRHGAVRTGLALSALLLGVGRAGTAWQSVHYGPRPDRIIDEAAVTYFVAEQGDDAHDGRTRETAWATLQQAADRVEPGETVLLTAGTYHQGVHIRKEGRPDAWITFVAEPGAEIRGSEVRTDWTPVAELDAVYAIPLPRLHGTWQRPETPIVQRTEQVFVNGVLLRQVSDRAMLKPRGVFFADDAAKLLMVCLEGGIDPNEQRTEVSTLTYAIAIGGPPNRNTIPNARMARENRAAYIRIDGFTIRHIANFSRMAAIQARGSWEHLIIENCDVQWVNWSGIVLNPVHNYDREAGEWFHFPAGSAMVRHNRVSHCGVQAMGGGGTWDVVFEYNIMDYNNYKGNSPWNEGGAIKTGFDGGRIVIRHNIARHNHNHGLWYDYGQTECVIENNFVYNALAGAVLNEVTPTPGQARTPDGQRTGLEPDAETVRQQVQQGTIIRNNILIGTRTPGGGGINISTSTDTRVYNNITMDNQGGGINLGGSATRIATRGLHRNHVSRNISFRDFLAATATRDSDDPAGRFFDNLSWDNLYLQTRSDPPFRISGLPAGRDAWKEFNAGRDNVYADRNIFRDPDRFDFTLVDDELTRQIGFDPDALRLDWSEFYLPAETRQVRRERLLFTPVDLSGVLNRALLDETDGDGRGGWSDQGPNDMSLLPVGEQVFDGVAYHIGPQDRGALLLDTPRVRPGGFPATVPIPVAAAFDQLNFLYTAAGSPNEGEVARFIVRFADGTSEDLVIEAGRQLHDWWTDPTWQQHAVLNDHDVYTAWQGPNRFTGKVTLFHLRWNNPTPDIPVREIVVTNAQATEKPAFFLLAISGGRRIRGADPRKFYLGYDGDVDAVDSAGTFIEPEGFNRAAFDAGVFESGRRGRGFRPAIPLHYPVPPDFPLDGEGTISVWLNADDWRTPERQDRNRRLGYTRVMTPFSVGSAPGERYSVWLLSFQSPTNHLAGLRLTARISGGGPPPTDVTDRIVPGQWFHLLVRWRPHPERDNHTRCDVFLDGNEIASSVLAGRADLIGDRLFLGVPANGGQPWRGIMDEFSVWAEAWTDERIAAYLEAVAVPPEP